MISLYKNIKAARVAAGLSQEQLAQAIGYTDRSSIAKIESGKVDLPQSKIAAIAECRPERLKSAGLELGVPENMLFDDADQLFALGKIADAAIIATMDRDHYGHVMQALDCGYDILLEKPISPDPRECLEIEEKANRLGKKITV